MLKNKRTKKMLKSIIFISWLISVTAVIFLSLKPGFGPSEEYNLDKIVHCGTYAFLTILCFLFTRNKKSLFILCLLLISIGGGVEYLQSFTPTRNASIGDFLANTIGVLIGAACGRIIQIFRNVWIKR